MWFFLSAHAADLDALLDARARSTAQTLGADPEAVRERLSAEVQRRLKKWPGPPTDDDLQRLLVDFEGTRLERYVTSGVFPKRYFGYLDTRGDTETWEWELREHVQCVRTALNSVAEVEVTDLDLVVTFLAEGGADMLQRPRSPRDRLHPVMDVGLDDIARGTADLSPLVGAVDKQCGSRLGSMIVQVPAGSEQPVGAIGRLMPQEGRDAYLMHKADMRDAIAGTGVMWVWEVRIADAKLQAEGRKRWRDRDRDGRFIAGSLVYNSGILHSETTHKRIREFSTGRYLYDRSEQNAKRRDRLPVLPPKAQLERVLDTGYEPQWTSWVAVYHILQRYGAWRALVEHTDSFDDNGNFVVRKRPIKEVVVESESTAEPVPAEGCGCSSVVPRLPLSVLLTVLLWRRRRFPLPLCR